MHEPCKGQTGEPTSGIMAWPVSTKKIDASNLGKRSCTLVGQNVAGSLGLLASEFLGFTASVPVSRDEKKG